MEIKIPDFNFPDSLIFLSVAGDRLSSDDIIPWKYVKENRTRLFNEYGPSETTGASSTYEFSHQEDFKHSPPIGKPNLNEKIFILDKHHSPVPIGVTGEIYIGGKGLSRGYLNRPKLTSRNFIPNPFSNNEGRRLYKTGDMARYLPDGNIEFIGRVDYQIKMRGYRIELGEIEATLTSCDHVESAVVSLFEPIDGNKILAAYVVVSNDKTVTALNLQKYLQNKLPEFMIPTSYTIMESFPLTPNGKINRLGFPPPDLSRPELEVPLVEPNSTLEKVLISIWKEVLNLDEIGVHDNFFDLGGHSLLVTQVISRINQTSSSPITIRDFFDAPTIAELASIIDDPRLNLL
jgi:acyl-coenzyme A synthetase/AMP-(fatty) acid ligase